MAKQPGVKWTNQKINKILAAWKRVWDASDKRIIFPLELFDDAEFNDLTSVGTLRERLSAFEKPDMELSPAQEALVEYHHTRQQYQEQYLQSAMTDPDRRNMTGPIFLAKCKYGYTETQKLEVKGEIGLDDILRKKHEE